MSVGVERIDVVGYRIVIKMKLFECFMDFLGKGWKCLGFEWCRVVWKVFLGFFYRFCVVIVDIYEGLFFNFYFYRLILEIIFMFERLFSVKV